MNAVWLVILVILAGWGVVAGLVLVFDAYYRKQYREQLEVRDWKDKVQAMRRMHDREGDA
jgi:hypothetical protein